MKIRIRKPPDYAIMLVFRFGQRVVEIVSSSFQAAFHLLFETVEGDHYSVLIAFPSPLITSLGIAVATLI